MLILGQELQTLFGLKQLSPQLVLDEGWQKGFASLFTVYVAIGGSLAYCLSLAIYRCE